MFEKIGSTLQNIGFIIGGAAGFVVLHYFYVNIDPAANKLSLYVWVGMLYVPLTIMWFLTRLKDLKKATSEYFLFSVGVAVGMLVFAAEAHSLSFYQWLGEIFVLTFVGALLASKKLSVFTTATLAGGGGIGLLAYGASSGDFPFLVLVGILVVLIVIAAIVVIYDNR